MRNPTLFLKRPRVKRTLIALAGLYVFYVLFGFIGVPRIIKATLEGSVAETLDRSVTLERATFNPFLLATTLEGLRVEDDHGDALLEMGRMRSNNQFFPIILGRISVARFELSDTTVYLKRDESGTTNVDRLLEVLGKNPEGEAGAEDTTDQPFAFYVGEVDVSNVAVEIADEGRSYPLREIMGPISFVATDIHTDHGREGDYSFDAHFGETGRFAWEGIIAVNPIGSSGSFSIENVDMSKAKPFWYDFLDADISGSYSMAGSYQAKLGADGIMATLEGGSTVINGFSLSSGSSETEIHWERLSAEGIAARYPEMAAQASTVALTAPHGLLVRNAAGELELPLRDTLLAGVNPESSNDTADSQAGPGSVDDSDETEFELNAVIDSFSVVAGHFEVIDESIAATPSLSMESFEAQLSNVAPFDDEAEMTISARFAPNGSGSASLQAKGRIPAKTLNGRFALEDFQLSSLQTAASAFAHATINDGHASLSAQFDADLTKMSFSVDAEGSVASLSLSETESQAPVFAAETMGFSGARFANEKLEIDRIELVAPVATVALLENGLNLTALLKSDAGVGMSEEEVEEEKEEEEGKETLEDTAIVLDLPFEAWIGEIEISSGQAALEDRTLEAIHRASFRDFAFKGEEISTTGDRNATLSMSGNFDGGGAFKLYGELNPLDFKGSSAVELSLNGFDLSATGPYWKKYLGRALNKGMLNVTASFNIQESQLDEATDVMVDQLKLGEKVDSEDSLGLPVGLAVAVLQDRNGVIELPPLKLTGDLSDPSTSGVGGIVMKALGNIIVKIATSPFAMFGGGAGGDNDMNQALFAGGAFDLDESLHSRLDRIAEILEDRPGLKLDLSSLVAQNTETNVFKRILIANTNDEDSTQGETVDAAPVDPLALLQAFDQTKYEEAAKSSYRDLVAIAGELIEGEVAEEGGNLLGNIASAIKTVAGIADDSDLPSFDEIEDKLFSESDLSVDLSWLNRLADEREKNVKDYLIQTKGIDPSRVFISGENQMDPSVSSSSVQFTLTD